MMKIVAYVICGIAILVGGCSFSARFDETKSATPIRCNIVAANGHTARCASGMSAYVYGEGRPVAGETVTVFRYGQTYSTMPNDSRNPTVKSVTIVIAAILAGFFCIFSAFAFGITGRGPVANALELLRSINQAPSRI
jgi:hypothetical protein